MKIATLMIGVVAAAVTGARGTTSAEADDRATVAALDTKYQAAVKANDAAMMDKILDKNFVLVTGNGTVYTKVDLLQQARDRESVYERQEDTQQTVRVYGNTAVVTALLWIKGTSKGQPFDFKVWFSDSYVRIPGGWRYAFGQAGCHLPESR